MNPFDAYLRNVMPPLLRTQDTPPPPPQAPMPEQLGLVSSSSPVASPPVEEGQEPLVIVEGPGTGAILVPASSVADGPPEGFLVTSDPITEPEALERAYNSGRYVTDPDLGLPLEMQQLFIGEEPVATVEPVSDIGYTGGPELTSAVFGEHVRPVNADGTMPAGTGYQNTADSLVRELAAQPDGAATDDTGAAIPQQYWRDVLAAMESGEINPITGVMDGVSYVPGEDGAPVTAEQVEGSSVQVVPAPAESGANAEGERAVERDLVIIKHEPSGRDAVVSTAEYEAYFEEDDDWSLVSDDPDEESVAAIETGPNGPIDDLMEHVVQPAGSYIADEVKKEGEFLWDVATQGTGAVTNQYDRAQGELAYDYISNPDGIRARMLRWGSDDDSRWSFLDENREQAQAIYEAGYDRDQDGTVDVPAGPEALWSWLEDSGHTARSNLGPVTTVLDAGVERFTNEYSDAVVAFHTKGWDDMSLEERYDFVVGTAITGAAETVINIAETELSKGDGPEGLYFTKWVGDNDELVKGLLANGYDADGDGVADFEGSRAVWEAYAGTLPWWRRSALMVAMDPLSYTPAAAAGGTRLASLGTNIVRNANTGGARVVGRVLQGTGELARGPYTILDEPVDIMFEGLLNRVKQIPGVSRVLESSTDTALGTEARNPIMEMLNSVLQRRDAGAPSTGAAPTGGVGGVTPGTGPNPGGPPAAAAQPGTTPNPNIGPNPGGPVTPQQVPPAPGAQAQTPPGVGPDPGGPATTQTQQQVDPEYLPDPPAGSNVSGREATAPDGSLWTLDDEVGWGRWGHIDNPVSQMVADRAGFEIPPRPSVASTGVGPDPGGPVTAAPRVADEVVDTTIGPDPGGPTASTAPEPNRPVRPEDIPPSTVAETPPTSTVADAPVQQTVPETGQPMPQQAVPSEGAARTPAENIQESLDREPSVMSATVRETPARMRQQLEDALQDAEPPVAERIQALLNDYDNRIAVPMQRALNKIRIENPKMTGGDWELRRQGVINNFLDQIEEQTKIRLQYRPAKRNPNDPSIKSTARADANAEDAIRFEWESPESNDARAKLYKYGWMRRSAGRKNEIDKVFSEYNALKDRAQEMPEGSAARRGVEARAENMLAGPRRFVEIVDQHARAMPDDLPDSLRKDMQDADFIVGEMVAAQAPLPFTRSADDLGDIFRHRDNYPTEGSSVPSQPARQAAPEPAVETPAPEAPTPRQEPPVRDLGDAASDFIPGELKVPVSRVAGVSARYNGVTELDHLTDRLYREVGTDELDYYLPDPNTGSPLKAVAYDGQLYFSNNPDLALSQGGKGVTLEFDPSGLRGSVNKSMPGWDFAWENSKSAEFRMYPDRDLGSPDEAIRGALRSITIRPDATYERKATKAVLRNQFKKLESQGWVKTELPDGSQRWTRPGATEPFPSPVRDLGEASPGSTFATSPGQAAATAARGVAPTGTIPDIVRDIKANWAAYDPPISDAADIRVSRQGGPWQGIDPTEQDVRAQNIMLPAKLVKSGKNKTDFEVVGKSLMRKSLTPEETQRLPQMVSARDKFDEFYNARQQAKPAGSTTEWFVEAMFDMQRYLDEITDGVTGRSARRSARDKANVLNDTAIQMAREAQLTSVWNGPRYVFTQMLGNSVVTPIITKNWDLMRTAGDLKNTRIVKKAIDEGQDMLRHAADHPTVAMFNKLGAGVKNDLLALTSTELTYNPDTTWHKVMNGVPLLGRGSKYWTQGISNRAIRNYAWATDLNPRLAYAQQIMTKNWPESTRRLRRMFGEMGVADDVVQRWLASPEIGQMPNYQDITKFSKSQNLSAAQTRQARVSWQTEIQRAQNEASAKVREVYFYGSTKLDEQLGKAVMFHYWMTRASALYLRYSLKNPMLMANYLRTAEGMKKEAERTGTPDWLSNMFKIMSGPFGYEIFGNPVALWETFFFFTGDRYGSGFVNEDTHPFWRAMEKTGFMPSIPLAAAVGVLGFRGDDQLTDFVNLQAFTRPTTVVANALLAHGFLPESWTPEQGYFSEPTREVMDFLRDIVTRAPGLNDVPDPVSTDMYDRQINHQIFTIARERGLIDEDLYQRTQDAEFNDLPLPLEVVNAINNPDSELWQEAFEQVASMDAIMVGTRLTPAGVTYPYARQGVRGDWEAMEDEVEPDSAEAQQLRAERDILNTVTPEAAQLTAADAGSKLVGDPDSREVYNTYMGILFGDPRGSVNVGGMQYGAYKISQMSDTEREALANQWAEQTGNFDIIDQQQADRNAFADVQGATYQEFKEWQKRLRKADGGAVGFWNEIIGYNDNARIWYEGLSDEAKENPIVLASADAYMAFQGIRNNYRDPAVQQLDDPTKRPFDPTAPTGGTGEGGFPEGGLKPEYIIEDIQEYQEEVAAYNAELQRMFPGQDVNLDLAHPGLREIYENDIYERTGMSRPRLSSLADEYLRWAGAQEQGADTSIEAWIALREQRKRERSRQGTSGVVQLSDGTVVDPSVYIGAGS